MRSGAMLPQTGSHVELMTTLFYAKSLKKALSWVRDFKTCFLVLINSISTPMLG